MQILKWKQSHEVSSEVFKKNSQSFIVLIRSSCTGILQPSPVYVYSEITPAVFREVYFLESMHKPAALNVFRTQLLTVLRIIAEVKSCKIVVYSRDKTLFCAKVTIRI